MKKDIYVYPAIFNYADDGISIEFPDLPGCLPCAHTTEEALKNAREAMGLHIYGMECDNEEIPEPSQIQNIHLEKNQVVVLIEVYMTLRRDAIENSYERTNVTLPKWLKRKAEEEKVNFSFLLQNALKKYLGVSEYHEECIIKMMTLKNIMQLSPKERLEVYEYLKIQGQDFSEFEKKVKRLGYENLTDNEKKVIDLHVYASLAKAFREKNNYKGE